MSSFHRAMMPLATDGEVMKQETWEKNAETKNLKEKNAESRWL